MQQGHARLEFARQFDGVVQGLIGILAKVDWDEKMLCSHHRLLV
jgi:hypothetical protein